MYVTGKRGSWYRMLVHRYDVQDVRVRQVGNELIVIEGHTNLENTVEGIPYNCFRSRKEVVLEERPVD